MLVHFAALENVIFGLRINPQLSYHDIKIFVYVQVLSPAFGGMIAFVKETEPLLERGQGQVIRPDESMAFVYFTSTSCTLLDF